MAKPVPDYYEIPIQQTHTRSKEAKEKTEDTSVEALDVF